MFKPKSDAIKVGQDSFKIPARNGVQFGPSSILRFDITRNCGFIDAANSYLEMEIELTDQNNAVGQNASQPMLCLERDIGAQALLNQMTIRSSDGGRVIEELPNYNTYAKIHYNATKTQGALNRRSKLEGCASSYLPQDNPYYTANRVIPPVADTAPTGNNPGPPTNGLLNANESYKSIRRKVCLPLISGIFQNPRSFPAMMIPLEVEFILEDGLRALRVANYGDGDSTVSCKDIPADGGGAPADMARRELILTDQSQFNVMGGATAASICPSNNLPALEGEQQLNSLNNCWYRVGQTIRVNGGGDLLNAPNYVAGEGVVCNITSIKVLSETHATAGDRGKMLITVDDDLIAAGGAGTGITIDVLSAGNGPLPTPASGNGGHGGFGYTVHNPRLVIQKVVPPPSVVQSISSAIAKGQYNQDIISYTNINNAVPQAQSVSTNIISADLSRVKSIFSVPTSQANTNTVANGNSLQGQFLDATRYIYQFNTKLIPDRRVELGVEKWPLIRTTPAGETLRPYRLGSFTSGFHRYEVEKALRSANINVKNLHFITNNPSATTTVANNFTATEPGCWLVARSMGAGVGTSANMVGKSLVLYLDYDAANATPTKLIKNFLVHVRTIAVGMDGVSVFY